MGRPDRPRDATGQATAEYCVGAVAAACVACALFAVTDDLGSFWDDLFLMAVRINGLIR